MAQLNSTTVNGDLTVAGSMDIGTIQADAGTITGDLEVSGALTNGGTAVSLDGHYHSRLTNNYGDGGEVVYVYDSGYYFMRPSNGVSVNGSSGLPWYNTHTSKLTVYDTAAITGITTVSARIQPYESNKVNLGYTSNRWMGIYSNAAVNTSSDLTVKKDIVEIDDRYMELFDLVQPYAYKFIDGQSGRVHTGFISQYVEQAMEQVGLSDMELGFFCKDPLTESIYDDDGSYIGEKEILDEDGNLKYFYSLRYEEYIAIMAEKIKRMENRIDELETKLEKVEEIESRLAALETA